MATFRISTTWRQTPLVERALPAAVSLGRFGLVLLGGMVIFALILLIDGHNGIEALHSMYDELDCQ